jgi:hypothetical protein
VSFECRVLAGWRARLFASLTFARREKSLSDSIYFSSAALPHDAKDDHAAHVLRQEFFSERVQWITLEAGVAIPGELRVVPYELGYGKGALSTCPL